MRIDSLLLAIRIVYQIIETSHQGFGWQQLNLQHLPIFREFKLIENICQE